MARKKAVVFKEYTPQQLLLLPQSLEERIPATQLVRVVNEVVERMNINELVNLYQGGHQRIPSTGAVERKLHLKLQKAAA